MNNSYKMESRYEYIGGRDREENSTAQKKLWDFSGNTIEGNLLIGSLEHFWDKKGSWYDGGEEGQNTKVATEGQYEKSYTSLPLYSPPCY